MERFLFLMRHFKHRFLPWSIISWRKRVVTKVVLDQKNHQCNMDALLSALTGFFDELEKHHVNASSRCLMEQHFGFSVSLRNSSIPNAGLGLFIRNGTAVKGSVVAMYPGTVYYMMDPMFFQSLGNSYILRCVDGVHIDGRSRGLSRQIFRSCKSRDSFGPFDSCDASWLDMNPRNPLAVGQFVNNETNDSRANVDYHELDIPSNFPPRLLQFIPNVCFRPRTHDMTSNNNNERNIPLVRALVLVSTRDVHDGEELFSSYFTEIRQGK